MISSELLHDGSVRISAEDWALLCKVLHADGLKHLPAAAFRLLLDRIKTARQACEQVGVVMGALHDIVSGPATDDPAGFTAAPTRYTSQGRETIDRIRDQLGDSGFVAFCIGNALKYEDRAGAKGNAEEDAAKARWYRNMVDHVVDGKPDPRRGRDGFKPYVRQR